MASAQPSSAKRAQVQGAVLRATEELLAGGSSFADLNNERIATGAGISRTAFYFYFRDKRELLMRLTEDVTNALYGQADRWFSGEEDPGEEVRAALASISAMYQEHGPLLRAIVEVSTYDEEVAVFWRALLQRFADATTRRIEAEQEAGRAPRDVPAAATAFALVWMTERTFYQQRVQHDPVPREDLLRALAGIWTRAVYDSRG